MALAPSLIQTPEFGALMNLVELAKTINPVFGESKLITNANRDKIEKAGQFTLPNGLKDNQVARQVAQIKFKTQDYFQSLVSECEGFRSGVYNDNIGFAFGLATHFAVFT